MLDERQVHLARTDTTLVPPTIKQPSVCKARRLAAAALVLIGLWPFRLEAQAPPERIPLKGVLFELLETNEFDFVNAAFVDSLAGAIAAGISTFPIGSSSGAFTYRFEPALGVPVLSSATYGPWFAERATTLGRRGDLDFGFSFVSTAYASYDRIRFEEGDIFFNTTDAAPGFWEQPFSARSSFEIGADTVALFGTIALRSDLDVGVVLPITRVTFRGTKRTELNFDRRTELREASGSSTGLGDMAVRAKWRIAETRSNAFAAQVETRFPTGDVAEMRGVGETTVKVSFLGSGTVGPVSPHVNVGYTFARGFSEPVIPDLDYVVGFEVAAQRNVTITADVIGRWMHDGSGFELLARRTRLLGILIESQASVIKDIHPLLQAVGAKVKLLQQGLAVFQLLIPLNDQGLKPKITPVVGFEYAF